MHPEPFSEAWLQEPYAGYRRLRDAAPVFWSELLEGYVVSRYADVRQVLSEPETFVSKDSRPGAGSGSSPWRRASEASRAWWIIRRP